MWQILKNVVVRNKDNKSCHVSKYVNRAHGKYLKTKEILISPKGKFAPDRVMTNEDIA